MRKLTIVRGWSGSGKSTHAEAIQPDSHKRVAADDFPGFHETGTYVYVPWRIGEAHNFCRKRVLMLMRGGADHIVVHNTFVNEWEWEVYVDMAQDYGYDVHYHRCVGEFQNVHGVPDDKVGFQKRDIVDVVGEFIVPLS